jgi:phenylacetate-coenzyme A ligase PaaK-like adenylate-forming protein
LRTARAEIEAAFGRPVMNLYAAAEVGVIARSYPGSAGLHLNEDIAVYEPVDADLPARVSGHHRGEAPRHQRHQSRDSR